MPTKQGYLQTRHLVEARFTSKLGTMVFISGQLLILHQEGLLGILKTSVVHPDFRKNGIGDLMVKHRVKWLQEQGVQTIKRYAWFVDGVVPAQKMLMNNNFEPWGDIRGWWSSDHNWDYPCKICGSNCKCVARIFIHKV